MSRVQGKFSIPYSEPKVHPPPFPRFTHTTLHKSLYLPSAGPFFLLQRLELDTLTQRQTPSKQSPKKRNKSNLPASLPIRFLNHQPHRCLVGILPVSVSLYISIYLSTPSITFSRITRYSSSSANQQQQPTHYYPRIIHLMLLLPSR